MKQDRISARQLYVILAAGLLSPMVQALPSWTAATAGEGAWLTGILAFPVLLGGLWMGFALLRMGPEGGGLCGAFRAVLGRALGKAVTAAYLLWALFLMAVGARLYGERLLPEYGGSSLPVLLGIILVLVGWMGAKKLEVFARAAEIFYLVLSLVLGVVLFFSILDMTPENVLPVWYGDLPGIAAATAIPVGVAGAGIFGAFLAGQVEGKTHSRRRGLRWLAAGCGAMALLQFGVLAQLGPVLAAQMDAPFFEIARGVGVSGAFQRVESIVSALWVFSDFVFLGLLAFAVRNMAGSLLGERAERWGAPAAAALTFIIGVWLFPDGFAVKNLAATLVPAGNLFFAFLVPAAALCVGGAKRAMGKGAHLVAKEDKQG